MSSNAFAVFLLGAVVLVAFAGFIGYLLGEAYPVPAVYLPLAVTSGLAIGAIGTPLLLRFCRWLDS